MKKLDMYNNEPIARFAQFKTANEKCIVTLYSRTILLIITIIFPS